MSTTITSFLSWKELPYAPFFLLWYLVDISLTLANYVNLLHRKRHIIDQATRDVYLSFVVIGIGAYFICAAACFVWAMKTDNLKSMRNKIQLGVMFVWIGSDVPIFFTNFYLFLNYGWFDWLQALQFLTNLVSFFMGALVVWTAWMWFTAKRLQRWVGDPLYPSALPGHAGPTDPPPPQIGPLPPTNFVV